MARLTVHSVATAPEAAKARVEAAEKNNGFLPNLIGVLANSPAALAMYQDVGALNATTSLSAGEREVVQITAAVVLRKASIACGSKSFFLVESAVWPTTSCKPFLRRATMSSRRWKWCWVWLWPLCAILPIIWHTMKSTRSCKLMPDVSDGLACPFQFEWASQQTGRLKQFDR